MDQKIPILSIVRFVRGACRNPQVVTTFSFSPNTFSIRIIHWCKKMNRLTVLPTIERARTSLHHIVGQCIKKWSDRGSSFYAKSYDINLWNSKSSFFFVSVEIVCRMSPRLSLLQSNGNNGFRSKKNRKRKQEIRTFKSYRPFCAKWEQTKLFRCKEWENSHYFNQEITHTISFA